MLQAVEFRARLTRISLVLLGLSALVAMAWDVNLALGVMLGGAAGLLAFWLLSRRVQQFTELSGTEIQVAAMRGTIVRLGVYAAALLAAYRLDPTGRMPLLAAIYGLMVPRVVMYGLAFTSLRRPAGEK